MSAKPNPEKLGIVVFFVIFAIMLIASLMFIFEGGWGAIYIFILASAVSIVIAFLFFTYFNNDIIDYYSDKITLQKLWRFLLT